jgi:hypothetical protein
MRIAVILALTIALLAPASASATKVASYCSETGDVCYGIYVNRGAYTFRLTLAAKYFARYRLCLKPAGMAATCKRFRVRKMGANWGGRVNWLANFPQHGPTRYKVTWRLGKRALGPSLYFNSPAPA